VSESGDYRSVVTAACPDVSIVRSHQVALVRLGALVDSMSALRAASDRSRTHTCPTREVRVLGVRETAHVQPLSAISTSAVRHFTSGIVASLSSLTANGSERSSLAYRWICPTFSLQNGGTIEPCAGNANH
jgi:hypothetical protein